MRVSRAGVVIRLVARGLLLTPLLTPLPLPVSAATINVPDDYSTIQAAINVASSGDTIFVKDGTYVENLTIGKSLTIQSVNGPAATSIVAASSGSPAVTISEVTNVTLDGFAVSGGSIGVRLTSKTTGVTLTDLEVTNADGIGVSLDGSHSNVVIEDTTVGGTPKTGIYMYGELAHVLIEDVTISGTTTCGIHKPPDSTLSDITVRRVEVTPTDGPGIWLEDWTASTSYVVADVEIDYVTVTGGSVGIYVSHKNADSENVSVTNCTVSETSGHGIQLDSVRNGAAIANNTVSDAGGYGLHLTSATTSLAPMLSGNVLNNNANGLYLSRFDLRTLGDILTPAAVAFISPRGTALYLDTLTDVTVKGYDLRYSSLSTGIHMESCNNMVVDGIPIGDVATCGVSAGGTCNGVTLRDIDVNCAGGHGFSLDGTMSNVLIEDSTVSGTPANGACLSGTLTLITIDNLTVTGGTHGIHMSQPDAGSGGLSITNCTISGTSSDAIHVDKVRGPAMISNNSVSGATGTGYGMYLVSGTGTGHRLMLMVNTIENCPNGVYAASFSDGEITRNTVRNNTGNGIYLSSCGGLTIWNNYIADNEPNGVDAGSLNSWNKPKTPGANIIGGSYIGGNYWSDYAGVDADDDGLGDTPPPYTCDGSIATGDYLPLVLDSGDVLVTLSLAEGWNLVSIPVAVGDNTAAEVFTNIKPALICTWDPESGCYDELIDESVVEIGRAYWIAVTAEHAGKVVIAGVPLADPGAYELAVLDGWNMVGSVYHDTAIYRDWLFIVGSLAADPLQRESIYWWDAVKHVYVLVGETDPLVPGVGYWLASTDGCTIAMAPPT